MSGDEVFVLLVCGVTTLITWGRWFWQAITNPSFASSWIERTPLLVIPQLCVIGLFSILRVFASHDVRDSSDYLLFYMLVGGAWVGLSHSALNYFGLSARDDVIERGNASASFAISGALIGITLCFAGANIGDGPGWWVVVFSAALSTATLFVLWLVLDSCTGLADSVTIERDPASGLRLGGFFIGVGLILGRAVAGNWISADATLVDFAKMGWPALVVLAVAIGVERMSRVSMERRVSNTLLYGGMPAVIYVSIGIVVVYLQGRWK